MNLINLSDGKIDILRNLVRREIQHQMAGEGRTPDDTVNIDQAAWLLGIYDSLSTIASKWTKDYPQFGFKDIGSSGQEREILKGTNQYLAGDGTLKKRHLPD